jgi:ribosomal-protein-alanine N-acetyltransferase
VQLATDRLILREFVEDDWRAVHAIESIPDVVRYQTFAARTEDDARVYVQGILVSAREMPRTTIDLAVTVKGDDTLRGRVGMMRNAAELREAMLWFVIGQPDAGKGYATEAACAMLAYAFEELKLHRVYGDCDDRNVSSARVMEKLGMRREAHFIQNVWIKDEWCDSLNFAMLDHEWAAR